MERREFLLSAAAGAAAFAGLNRSVWAQGRGNPPDWSADPGKPANVSPDKLARISLMTLNFNPIIKSPNPPNPNATPNPNAPPASRMLDVFDLAQMYVDVYGVHNIEFQHSSIPSTEISYLKELRAHIEKAKSRMQQINLEISPMFVSVADSVLRVQCIDLTKRWVDHAAILNCPKVMVNQGSPSQENKEYMIAALKTVGDYGKSKGVKISMETRGGGGGNRGRAGAPGPCRTSNASACARRSARLGAAERGHREVEHLLERRYRRRRRAESGGPARSRQGAAADQLRPDPHQAQRELGLGDVREVLRRPRVQRPLHD